jgi:hypothetical protein
MGPIGGLVEIWCKILCSVTFFTRDTQWVFPPAFFAGKFKKKLSNTTISSQNGGVVGEMCPN